MTDLEVLWEGYLDGRLTDEEVRRFLDGLAAGEGAAVGEGSAAGEDVVEGAGLSHAGDDPGDRSDDEKGAAVVGEGAVYTALLALLRERSMEGLGEPEQEDLLFRRIMEKDKAVTPVRKMPFVRGTRRVGWPGLRRWAAAAVFLLLATGIYLWVRQTRNTSYPTTTTGKGAGLADIMPGKQGAILTLANGRKVVLDSLGSGRVAVDHGSEVSLVNGELAYNVHKGSGAGEMAYNTLTTPRGRTFQLALPDGTKVWLNASSSIRYPTTFATKERRVEIEGEAYFEVASEAGRPFIAKIGTGAGGRGAGGQGVGGDRLVEVLGTHFNINAYSDEPAINTTLLEGSVRMVAGGSSRVLTAGQQAQVVAAGGSTDIKLVEPANADQSIAWQKGLFNFQDMSFDKAMRQLSRWYDIEVVYENGVPDIEFEGELGRDVSLSKVLYFLEKVGVHYRIEEGKRLVISR